LRTAAAAGDVAAQKNLCFAFGTTVDGAKRIDGSDGIKACASAAERGDISAQYTLGTIYDQGLGVPRDYREAFRWYTMAANGGHYFAQYNLGGMYHDGQGVPKDDAVAAAWWRKAADAGY